MASRFGQNKALAIGIIVLAASIPIYLICLDLDSATYLCTHPRGSAFPPGSGTFLPGATYALTCSVSREIGQDLTFWAQFFTSGGGETDPIPAHVEIRNPQNQVIVDQDFFDDNIVIYVKPEMHGNYTATITNIEDPNNRTTSGVPHAYYAFGYLVPLTTNAYDEVYNPVGSAIRLTGFIAGPAAFAGIILVVYGISKALKRLRGSG